MIVPFAVALLALTPPPSAPIAQPISPAEKIAAAKAAGFRVRGGAIVNECDAVAAMIAFERRDLNRDGVDEMIVSDGGACYGGAGSMFVVLRKSTSAWVPILSAQGIMTPLAVRHGGWVDIEIGGPGMGKMPVARWDGAKYQY